MGDEVAPDVAQRRLTELQELQKGQTLVYHQSRVGESARVLIDGLSRHGGNQLAGRDLHQRVVNVDLAPGHGVVVGDQIEVRIMAATPHSLLGEPLEPKLCPDSSDADLLAIVTSGPVSRET